MSMYTDVQTLQMCIEMCVYRYTLGMCVRTRMFLKLPFFLFGFLVCFFFLWGWREVCVTGQGHEDPTARSISIKHRVNFYFIFANQTIKVWTQHISKYQKAKIFMLNELFLMTSFLHQYRCFVKSKTCLAMNA